MERAQVSESLYVEELENVGLSGMSTFGAREDEGLGQVQVQGWGTGRVAGQLRLEKACTWC